ncbi:MAG: glycoside hydrolase family 30 beta sandwich domain-containing protein [Ferruginibacter sp.]
MNLYQQLLLSRAFSKFIRPGAKRIISSSNRDKLQTTAFINPDGKNCSSSIKYFGG